MMMLLRYTTSARLLSFQRNAIRKIRYLLRRELTPTPTKAAALVGVHRGCTYISLL